MKKDIFISWKSLNLKLFSVITLFTLTFSSCSDDDDKSIETKFELKGEATINADELTGEHKYEVRTNKFWKIETRDGSWALPYPAQGKGDGEFTVNISENMTMDARAMQLVLVVDGVEQPNPIVINQAPAKFISRVVMDEKFDWLKAYGVDGNGLNAANPQDIRFDKWTAEEVAMGWSTTKNPGNNTQLLYAGRGYIKLGVTSFGGDLISPPLSNVRDGDILKVTFKAAGYLTAGGGAKDDDKLTINILNGGESDVKVIEHLDNFPNTTKQDNDGVVNNVWSDDRAFSFTVTGATAQTQIQFIGGDFILVSGTKNRVHLDDIKVVTVEK